MTWAKPKSKLEILCLPAPPAGAAPQTFNLYFAETHEQISTAAASSPATSAPSYYCSSRGSLEQILTGNIIDNEDDVGASHRWHYQKIGIVSLYDKRVPYKLAIVYIDINF